MVVIRMLTGSFAVALMIRITGKCKGEEELEFAGPGMVDAGRRFSDEVA